MSLLLSTLRRFAGSEFLQDAASLVVLCAFIIFVVFGTSIISGMIIAERLSP